MRYIYYVILFFAAVLFVACDSSTAPGRTLEEEYAAAFEPVRTGNFAEALSAMMAVRDDAIAAGDEHYMAKAEYGLYAIYQGCGNNDEALRHLREAYGLYELLGDSAQVAETRLSMSSMVDAADSERLLLQLLAMDSAYCDRLRRTLALRELAVLRYDSGRHSEAEELIMSLIKERQANAQDSAYLGMARLAMGRAVEAEELSGALSGRLPAEKALRYKVLKATGRTKEALEVLEDMSDDRSKMYTDIASHNLSGALTEYYEANRALREKELRQTRAIMWLIVAVGALVAALAVVLFLRYRRRKNEVIEANVRVANELQDAYAGAEAERDAAKRSIKELMRGRYALLDSVCRIAYESPTDDFARRQISDRIAKLIEQLSGDKAEFAKLEEMVDGHYDGVLSALRRDMPKIKDLDYRLFVFAALGFSPGAIALLLGQSKTSIIYDRKRRLRARLLTLAGGERYAGLLG